MHASIYRAFSKLSLPASSSSWEHCALHTARPPRVHTPTSWAMRCGTVLPQILCRSRVRSWGRLVGGCAMATWRRVTLCCWGCFGDLGVVGEQQIGLSDAMCTAFHAPLIIDFSPSSCRQSSPGTRQSPPCNSGRGCSFAAHNSQARQCHADAAGPRG